MTEIVDKPIGQMTFSERWAVFMEYRTDRNKRDIINEIVQYEEGIAMASKVLLNITKEDHEKARQLSKLKYELDMQSRQVRAKRAARAEGHAEGHAEGLAEGQEQKALEIAQRMLNLGFTINDITAATELSEEQVRALEGK